MVGSDFYPSAINGGLVPLPSIEWGGQMFSTDGHNRRWRFLNTFMANNGSLMAIIFMDR